MDVSRLQGGKDLPTYHQPWLAYRSEKHYYLLKLLARDGRDRGIEARNAGAGQVLRHIVYLLHVAFLIFQVREVKPSHAICLQFDEAWSDYATFQINSLTSLILITRQDDTALARDRQGFLDELAADTQASIGERDDLARHDYGDRG